MLLRQWSNTVLRPCTNTLQMWSNILQIYLTLSVPDPNTCIFRIIWINMNLDSISSWKDLWFIQVEICLVYSQWLFRRMLLRCQQHSLFNSTINFLVEWDFHIQIPHKRRFIQVPRCLVCSWWFLHYLASSHAPGACLLAAGTWLTRQWKTTNQGLEHHSGERISGQIITFPVLKCQSLWSYAIFTLNIWTKFIGDPRVPYFEQVIKCFGHPK